MAEISKNKLLEFRKKYEQNEVFKVLRLALVKNPLSDISSVIEAEKATTFKFSIDLPTLSVNNQRASGRCWLFAGLNVLREKAAKLYNVKDIEFSQNYQAFWDKYEKSNYFIEAMDDFLDSDNDDRTFKHLLRMGIQDGGQWDMFVNLVNKYGVVPKDVMPETHASSNTRFLNRLINMKLRQYAMKARSLAQNKRVSEIAKLKEETLYELYSLLATNLGLPPTEFDFEYVDKDKNYHLVKDLNPLKFYENIGLDLNDYISVINSPTDDKPYNKNYTIAYLGNVVEGKLINHLNLPMKRLEELIIKQLKDDEVVWFGCDVSFDGDRKKGIWDDQSYDFKSTFQMDFSMSKKDRLDYLSGAMNHAMVITGVNLVEDKPTKWKIENSWGEENGLKGYYLMSQSWFLEHTYQIVINKKYLTKDELKAYHEAPKILKPWDPMGSLAL